MEKSLDVFEDNDIKWSSLDIPVYKQDLAQNNSNVKETETAVNPKKYRIKISGPVLTIQLISCLSVLLLAYISKLLFPSEYSNIKKYYDKSISTSIFFDGDLKNIDLSEMFDTDDEI